ncbi:PREDICTED: sushi, von Willebrand factor type A, EGF and pentraxin domain-containing protein 1-like [Wasmannia auropunctata]|uniref:sushi, von Willebrand factor type A, EGF and pentraxin domain-containing protein 1-like n=1 Tax=Wasmannia auropunctata TaxID=64793 RepID=UPI0005EF0689|nr:PREDICTED: sushi, von Willebrand factor type A, EGF and pentraxin domain-containing protein 1-like [Wasmannia auropunctata]
MGFSRVLPLLIGALSLFSNIAVERVDDDDGESDRGLEIGMNDSVSSTFLNVSQETNEDQRYWYEHLDSADRMLKSKTDILSRLLKMHIDQLRNRTDQVELVFLVDASGSVGAENFRSELNFVTKLLSDFTVDTTAARIALVTFGGRGSVYRNVDQISRHGPNDHKCYLLNKQFSNITYSGGGTYTRGALLEALAILEKGREAASKVVFLITDGFSNGGDPRPAAHLLKNTGATVFTFGIRTGNVEELHDIASQPGYTHSYLLDSFAEFEALARRALHRDLKTGQYVAVTLPTDCNSLCSNSTANRICCDELATCTCGTATGHYACICPPGYFGSGLRGFCQPCPNGTYASGNTSGDSTAVCVPCPDANHITVKVLATSVVDCVCASGFATDGYKCEAITCPKLRIPENGYLVKASACSNVVHAACGVRCRIGFHLTGDSIRLCGKDGAWSGNEPQCLLKTCPALRAPPHGRVKCEHDEDYQHQFEENSTVYPIDTRCLFRCDIGFQLRGSKVRNCLPLSRWDGLKVTCKAVKCDPLPQIANGDITPEICTGPGKVPFATNCTITCNEGFALEGPTGRTCIGRTGIWSQRHRVNRCVDKTPPSLNCPTEIVAETAKGQSYAYVNWTVPEVTDNANASPILWTKPHIVLPWKAKIGTHVVAYVAQDASGNKARCKFKVKVLDREPPTIENCVDPPTFYTDLDSGLANVTWDEPVFYDNSRISVHVNQSHQPGKDFLFPVGRSKVFYNATDKYGNRASCVLNITVEDVCKSLRAPANGRLNCSSSGERETQCVVACEDGYDFAIEPTNFNIVNDELLLKCNSSSHMWESNHLPECSESQTPKTISQEGNVILQNNESAICDNQTALRELSEHVANDLKLKLLGMCDNDIECDLVSFDPKCEDDLSSSKNIEDNLIRRRRFEPGHKQVQATDMLRDSETIMLRILKRAARLSRDLNKNNTRSKRKRDRIEIKFKFIGKIIEENFDNPKRGVQKLRERIDAMAQVGKLDLLDNRTNQEIARLALNLHLVFKEPQDLCDPGSVLKRHGCVKCPAGTFYNSSTRTCQPCPFGQYQDATASLTCVPCPEYTFTKRMHARSLRDCIPVCRPGYYSRRKRYHGSHLGMGPCAACDIGFYQPSYGQSQCLPCPSSATTEKRGSADVNDCLPIRDEEIDDCPMDPCLNGGRCLRDESGFFCECRDYYVGSKCERFRDPCYSSPCLNDGTCKTQQHPDNFVSYECACKSSYTGDNCEIYVDECSTNLCQNGGRCVSTESDFACECRDGFEGQLCEVPMDHCELAPCEEGSACHTVNGTWQCLCKPGFLGRHCNLLPCDWLPCHANAICVNVEEVNATRRSYRCECPDGYTGEDCATKIDHCESSPCLNNGRCVDRVHDYVCECPIPFTGRDCETELSSDYVMHFTKSGTTDYVAVKGPARDLPQLSVCLWLQSMDTFNYGTVLSYATAFYDNAFTLTDYNGLVLYVNGEKVVTDVKVNDGNWHFMCVTWQSERGSWRVFVDGILKDSGVGLAQATTVRADGSLVVGQEQDRLGGGFSESEAFLGRLSSLDIWDVVLNESDVTKLWISCEKYHGNLVAWAQMRQYVHGDIAILASPFCRRCPLPVVPFKGNIKVSEDLSEVTYYCDSGYMVRFDGEEYRSLRRKCLKHGQWEGYDTPICTKIKCGFPGYFPRGRIHGESYSFEDEIYYSCTEGYELRGNPHRICNSDGKWIGLPPICIGTTCKNLLAPENGDIEYILEENERDDVTILQAGQQLEFKCNPGYRLMGERYLTCLETGVWDYKRPSCMPYGCPSPKQIEHGYIIFSSSGQSSDRASVRDPERNTIDDPFERTYHYNDVVGFSCHRGYKFRGNHNLLTEFKLQCSANGTWTGFVPDCVPRTCPWPDRVEDARLFLRMRDNIIVEIPTEGDITLEPDRKAETRRNESDAASGISPEMFVSGTEIAVVCDSGYDIVGERVRTCTEEERWSSTFASCEPRNCSVEEHPIFKFFKETEDKTVLKNNNTDVTSLESDEKWYGKGNVRVYRDLEIFIEGNSYGRRVILTCRNDGRINLHKSIANETISNITWMCNKIVKWEILNSLLQESILEQLLNDSTDICVRSCALPQIPDGYIDNGNNTDDDNDRRAIDSVVTFKCRHGYILEGDERSICLPDTRWSALPSCKPVVCGKPPVLANAILKSDGGTQNYTFGNMISYQCVPGYRVFGQANLRCLGSGKWSRLNGRCSKISCGKPQIQHGTALYGRSYLFQDQLTYVCPDGKKRGMIACQADGTWSELPRCDGSRSM